MLALLIAAESVVRAEGLVYLEIVTSRTFPIEGSQELARKLGEVGADNLRIRQGGDSDRPKLDVAGTAQTPIYNVTAVVDSSGRLHVPGATFSTSSPGAIRDWIAKLKSAGADGGLNAGPGAFGLTGKELLDLHTALAAPVALSTKDVSARDAAGAIVRGLRGKVNVAVDASAAEALAGDETVFEELRGLSSGSALAAILRPLGLVVVPQKSRTGEVSMVIVDSRRSEQSWPIGWPLEKAEKDVMPGLFKFLPVEINDFALSDALGALQSRLEVPLLYDHNSLAREGVEITEVKVSHPKGQTYYKRVIERLLAQARLKAEVRVDEAGKPLLWISTIRN
jgi:hypothetical protein